ncbi:hypothetical protein CFC21_092997, partial [Triticum aestivum]
ADEAKAKGNAAFSAGRFEEAAGHFSDAIALAPANHVLYSNRSAALASIHRYSDALADAEKTVELKPDWAKGYSRLGAAHLGLGDAASAAAAYEKGLALDPSNEGLKAGLADAKKAAAAPPRRAPSGGADAIGQMFQGPELWTKIASDPATRAYLDQPDFMQMLREVQRNPSSLNTYLSDPRMMQVLSLMLNIKIQTPQDSDFPQSSSPARSSRSSNPRQRRGRWSLSHNRSRWRCLTRRRSGRRGKLLPRRRRRQGMHPTRRRTSRRRSSITQRPWNLMTRTSPTSLTEQRCTSKWA